MAHSLLHSLFVFILGTVVGSFLNVCIYRLPREESVIWPASKCPHCAHPIRWFDNVPILSFFILRGRCRDCQGEISVRYATIETLTGIIFLWVSVFFGWTAHGVVALILFCSLLVASVVDLEHQIIPDEISFGGLAVGLILSSVFPEIYQEAIWWKGLIQALIGALLGGGMIYVTGMIGDFVFKKESMGGGDVKLLAMLGAFLGWKNAILIFLLAPILALPLGLFLKFARRVHVISYGPFLSLAGWISFVWGDKIIQWYLYGMRFY